MAETERIATPLGKELIRRARLAGQRPVECSHTGCSERQGQSCPLHGFEVEKLSHGIKLDKALEKMSDESHRLQDLLSTKPNPHPNNRHLGYPISHGQHALFYSEQHALFCDKEERGKFFTMCLCESPEKLTEHFNLLKGKVKHSSRDPFSIGLIEIGAVEDRIKLAIKKRGDFARSMESLLTERELFRTKAALLPKELLRIITGYLISSYNAQK